MSKGVRNRATIANLPEYSSLYETVAPKGAKGALALSPPLRRSCSPVVTTVVAYGFAPLRPHIILSPALHAVALLSPLGKVAPKGSKGALALSPCEARVLLW